MTPWTGSMGGWGANGPAPAVPGAPPGPPPVDDQSDGCAAGAGPFAAQPPMLPVHGVMQLHNSYFIEETDQGFRISDQHALHERVLFKEISERLRDSRISAQHLLTPQMIQVTEQDVLMVEEHGGLFERVGLDVRAAGPRMLAINAIPQVLGPDEAPAFIRDVLDRLEEENEDKSFAERLEEVAAALACRAAVKAGDALSGPEIESIIRRANDAKVQETCPHGRPTTLYFSIDDLEKRFGRK
jgi:DNA mismatch repair protein MutL